MTKVLIIKLGAMGDVLRTTGVLPVLKEKYNGAEIWWLVDETSREILEGNPDVDNIIVFEEKNIRDTAAMLKKEGFTLVINLEESMDAVSIATGLGARCLGLIEERGEIVPAPGAEEMWKMSILGPSPENDILKKENTRTYQEIVKAMLGLERSAGMPYINTDSENRKYADNILKKHGLAAGQRIIGINFGSGERWPTKRLPVDRVCELIEVFSSSGDNALVIFGGKSEAANIDIIRTKYPDLLYALDLPVKVFAALIGKCEVLITTDTLALHTALAVKTNLIALFGPTSAAEIELFGLGRKLIAPVSCYCCYKKKCSLNPFCMDMFNPAEIMGIIEKLSS
ncbi:MAG: glycosyltransferase family 9 protein [Elusimicrobiota bacterium]